MVLVGAVWSGAIALFLAITVQDNTPVGVLLRDPQETTESPWYLGLVSNLGLIGWTCGATLFLGGTVVLRSIGASRTTVRSLLYPGALTTLLLIDDTFLLHDDWLQRVANLEWVAYGLYLIAALAWLILYRREIMGGPWPVGVMALAALALSVVVDVLLAGVGSDWRLLLEESAKFVGIWTWAAYAALAATACITQAVSVPATRSGR